MGMPGNSEIIDRKSAAQPKMLPAVAGLLGAIMS